MPAKGQCWAPEIHFYKGAWYLFTTVTKTMKGSGVDTGTLPFEETRGTDVYKRQMQDCIRTYGDPAENDFLCTSVLCELKNQMQRSEIPLKQDAAKQIYLDIVDYVKYSVNSNLLVRDIAAYFGYNEKYISHVFSRIAGVPLKQYILNQKIEHARALLTDGNATIAEITDLCGFNDSHTFMRAFKKATGFTPSEYRNVYACLLYTSRCV